MHYIMNKDIPVIEVETAKVLIDKMCPLALRFDDMTQKAVYKWIRERGLPIIRANASKIYNAIKLPEQNKDLELMYATHGASINDNFWIADESEIGKLKYTDVSVFNNKLNVEMCRLALTGEGTPEITEKDISAEYTGQGALPKCFMAESDGIYMYKSGNKFNINNELIAGHIAKILGLKSAKYEKAVIFGLDCTRTKILSNESVNWETAFWLLDYFAEDEFTPQDYAIAYFTADYCNMVIFDAIVLNENRNIKKWAFEIDANTNEIIGMAPSFDYSNTFTASISTMSDKLFDGPRKLNLLEAGREAYKFGKHTIDVEALYNSIDDIDLVFNKKAMKNRLEYIMGARRDQRDCYYLDWKLVGESWRIC